MNKEKNEDIKEKLVNEIKNLVGYIKPQNLSDDQLVSIKELVSDLSKEGLSDYAADLYSSISLNQQKISTASSKKIKPIVEGLVVLDYEGQSESFDLSTFEDPFPKETLKLVKTIKSLKTIHKKLKMFISGRPGTGKTMYVKNLAKLANMPIYKLNASRLISSYVGETQKNIDRLLNEIKAINGNGIILIDEMDSIIGNRETANGDEYKRMIGSFNSMLDELPNGSIVIGISNISKMIDPAILRRFNVKITLDVVEPESFIKVLEKNLEYENIEYKDSLIRKIVDYYFQNNMFTQKAELSMVEQIVNSKLFLGTNIYKKLIELIEDKTDVEIKDVRKFDLNYKDRAEILDKDYRTIKKNEDGVENE